MATSLRVQTAALSALTALAAIVACWGFTVDDALISARVAHHVATGAGYRFNAGGPVTDAVTPLGWAYVLAPFASASVWGALDFARYSGAALCVVAAAVHGARIATVATSWRRVVAACSWGGVLPLAAWASAGMETAWVIALGTLAVDRRWWGALAAGVAAAWRPELVPWALVLRAGYVVVASDVSARRWQRAALCNAALTLAPVALVLVIRVLAFGDPAPLAVHAKPSDVASGAVYAFGAFRFCLAPILVVAPLAWRRLESPLRVVLLACGVHFLTTTAAGGDWMPLFRLFVPVLPGMLLVAARQLEVANVWASLVRLGIAGGLSALVWVQILPASVGVLRSRRRVSEGFVALVERPTVVAGLDVGWLGASTEGKVVDLAGVTDPVVAFLPGGHTSKALSRDFLLRKRIDTLVLLLAPREHERLTESAARVPSVSALRFERHVEQRVTKMDGFSNYTVEGTLPLEGTQSHYLVLRLPEGASPTTVVLER